MLAIPTIYPKVVRPTPEGCSVAVGRGSELSPVLSLLHRHHSRCIWSKLDLTLISASTVCHED